MSAPVSVYVVLLRPAESVGGDQYQTINAFEFTLKIDPAPGSSGAMYKLQDDIPVGSVDVGGTKDFAGGIIDYIVGVADATPVLVTEGAAV